MSARRLLATLLFALVGAVALATPAMAATDYPPKRPPVIVTQNTVVTPGVTVLVLRGFAPHTPIAITITGPNGSDTRSLGQVTSDANGNATVHVSLSDAGNYVVSARGRSADGSMRTVSVALMVEGTKVAAADQNVSPSGLVHTGADLTTLWAGLGLVLSGTLFIMVARSRRRVLA